ncbi:MAG: DUF4832 domain-containing protein [Bacteroidales bacterium]|nr:DUF4832 domain-containing protein [Bacteroidales bacterium]
MIALLVAGTLVSCHKEPVNDGSKTEGETVNISPDRKRNLKNPFSGWFLYSGVGDGLADNFWEAYDNFDSSVGKVNVSDYCTTLLIRFKWSQAEPEEGKYFWTDDVNTKEAQRLKYLVEGAKQRGLKIAFGFSLDSRDQHFNCTPQYVKDKGCKTFETTTGTSTKVWSPYPDDPVFQECYAKFIHAFAQQYNDPDLVQCIEGFGMGKWGEYHSCKYTTGDVSPREAVFDYVCDLFAKEFTKVPVVANGHRWLGCLTEWDGNKYDPDSERLVRKAVSKGFVVGSAALGMHTYFSTWEKGMLTSLMYTVPFTAEGGWVRASHGGSIKGDGYSDWAEVRKGEYDDAKYIHANTMDLRYNSNLGAGETWSWFNEAYDLVERFIQEGIYRLYPDRVVIPTSGTRDATVSIKHRWLNLGWSYCPTNVPVYQKYKFAFALLNPNTEQPARIFIMDDVHPSDWHQGSPKEYTSKITLDKVAAGNYTWALAIVDTTKGNSPAIDLSVKTSSLTSGGWLRLGKINVK